MLAADHQSELPESAVVSLQCDYQKQKLEYRDYKPGRWHALWARRPIRFDILVLALLAVLAVVLGAVLAPRMRPRLRPLSAARALAAAGATAQRRMSLPRSPSWCRWRCRVMRARSTTCS
jgi:hypothetical protein